MESVAGSDKMNELFSQLMAEAGFDVVRESVIKPQGTIRNAPLSFAQQQLWFLDQFDPSNSSYNISLTISLKGPLSVAVLEQSLSEIVRRHQTLRSIFLVVD